MRITLESPRQWLNEHAMLVYAATAGLACLTLIATLFAHLAPEPTVLPHDYRVEFTYFYDTTTGEVFVDTNERVAPFVNDAGNTCVQAAVFARDVYTPKRMFVAFFVKYTDIGKAMVEEYGSVEVALRQDSGFADHRLVSLTGEPGTWHPASSAEGQQVVSVLMHQNPRGEVIRCVPTRPHPSLKLPLAEPR